MALLAAVTMTWGNLAAFKQDNIPRLLGYSSISQAGYLLMGVAALPGSELAPSGLLYFFAAYAAANLGAFAVLQASGRQTIAAHAGLIRERPWLALAMAVCLLSFIGLPPLAGFVAKFVLFTATWQAGFVWLVILALINTVMSLYYYLRVIAPMFLQPPGEAFAPASSYASSVAVASALILCVLGIFAFLILDKAPALVLFV